MKMAGQEGTVVCSGCGERFAAPYEIGLWGCPLCKTGNDSALSTEGIVRAPASQAERKPVGMQLGHAWTRLLGRKPLYGYADRVIPVTCPECASVVNMTTNVRTARCTGCGTALLRG